MNLFKGMDVQELETQYNFSARRGPNLQQVFDSWTARSEALSEMVKAQIDLPYDHGKRDKLDFFPSTTKNGPLLIYIHGGYWQRGDKSIYGFISKAFIQHGVSVAILNYNLTPQVRVGQIPDQIRTAISWCWYHAHKLGICRDKIFVMGHSAGGHLTAMMMATVWSDYDPQLPFDLIKAAFPISGLFELEPLVHTSINQGPQMDIKEAKQHSPLFIPPVTNAPQLVIGGGAETKEMLRQSDDYANKFNTAKRSMERYNVPDADHFDVLEYLAQDDSVLFEKTIQLIQTSG